MRQTLERYVAGSEAMRSACGYSESPEPPDGLTAETEPAEDRNAGARERSSARVGFGLIKALLLPFDRESKTDCMY